MTIGTTDRAISRGYAGDTAGRRSGPSTPAARLKLTQHDRDHDQQPAGGPEHGGHRRSSARSRIHQLVLAKLSNAVLPSRTATTAAVPGGARQWLRPASGLTSRQLAADPAPAATAGPPWSRTPRTGPRRAIQRRPKTTAPSTTQHQPGQRPDPQHRQGGPVGLDQLEPGEAEQRRPRRARPRPARGSGSSPVSGSMPASAGRARRAPCAAGWSPARTGPSSSDSGTRPTQIQTKTNPNTGLVSRS